MDAVYVLGNGSKWDDNELRYSLRSVERYVLDLNRVFIVGERPGFLKNIQHLRANDPFIHNRDANIFHKTKIACQNKKISDNFLFVNDDHYIVQPIYAKSLPAYSRGDLANRYRIFLSTANSYEKRMKRTYDALKDKDFQTLNFDIHCPMVINKQKWLDAMSLYEWDTEWGGFIMKSLYGNTAGFRYYHMDDLKFGKPNKKRKIYDKLMNRWVFSISDPAINDDMKTVLNELYPEPSSFESQNP